MAIGGELFFTADEATHGNQVWETNGTAAGTVRLSDGHDVNGANGGIFPSDLTAVGNEVFFSASDFSHGYQIWETNGTAAGTQMVSDINPNGGGIFPSDLTAVGNTLYFVGYDPVDGMQLFESNGTAAGTQMVADIPGANGYPGCYPTDLTAGGGLLYFSATDSTHGTQLWSANPLTARRDDADVGQRGGRRDGGRSTSRRRAARCTSPGIDLTNHEQLWSSGGTVATTGRLTSGNASGGGVNPQMLTAAGNYGVLLGQRRGARDAVVVDDGDDAGCGGDADVGQRVGRRREPDEPGAVGGTVYFSGNDGVHGAQLWSSNGTAGGTGMVADIDGTATANVASPTNVSGTLFFTAYTLGGGYQVWQSNGTASGTVADTSLSTGGSSVPSGADGRVEQPLLHGAGGDAVGVADAADADGHLDQPREHCLRLGPVLLAA